ncbi:MAG: MFS transporter [Firmicutes bacterium]|nr:MFS transporter [Bacillota bacterium]
MQSAGRSTHYKWIALSNTTLGVLMASLNSSILIIALPVIFAGLKVDPLAGGQTGLLLWVLLGFNVATTVFLVTFGRLSDIFGRVKLYNLGFLIFTIGSVLCSITWSTGTAGELELIIFRLVQGVGGAFLFSNSAAILTDAFPSNQRGLALGLNQIAAVGGGVLGLVIGGLLAATGEWRWIFLVNVPIGILGTIWAYVALQEVPVVKKKHRLDIIGNVTLGLGILGIMLGLTYGIMPYGTQSMGWGNPFVIAMLAIGLLMLIAFVFVEKKVAEPLFHLDLFRIPAFALGNFSNFLGALARGGLQFMLIIWLQGIWLPLHGVSFANTPLQAGIDTLPQMVGFLVVGPLSGWLSDKYGTRAFATVGMLLSGIGFYLLNTLPVDFSYLPFALYLVIVGVGMGLFASPNSATIMNALPARYRGVGSGMRATFMNAGQMMSMGVFFSIVIAGLASRLPGAITKGLTAQGLPSAIVKQVASLPPSSSLFAALLGYNPLQAMVKPQVLDRMPKVRVETITGHTFFPNLIGPSFMHGLSLAFIISLVLSLAAAVASALIKSRTPVEDEVLPEPAAVAGD